MIVAVIFKKEHTIQAIKKAFQNLLFESSSFKIYFENKDQVPIIKRGSKISPVALPNFEAKLSL